MGNSYLLFEDFGDVFGRWFLSGMRFNPGDGAMFDEQQHAQAGLQIAASIRRVEIKPGEELKSLDGTPDRPGPGRYALETTFSDSTMVFNGRHRYLPGDAYRMGIWIKGDGSGAKLTAAVLDFTQAGSTSYTWNRSRNYRIPLCTLDFKGWRYIETELPGNGLGKRSIRGSSKGIDYPLDLSAFMIEAPRPAKDQPAFTKGTVQFGAVYIVTQQAREETLAIDLAYDNPEQTFAAAHGLTVTLQNGWRAGEREVNADWVVLDRKEEIVARGRQAMKLAAQSRRSFRIELKAHAQKMQSRPGPYRVQVLAADRRDVGSAMADLIITRPDSRVTLADFESDRGYFGLKAHGINPQPPEGDYITRTTTAQKHGGQRSLELPWTKGERRAVAVDPAVPGIPTEVALWLHGDGSGVYFYPLVGDKFGVISSTELNQWDLFLPRSTSGPLQNAVKVDWTGWREVTFRLPAVPPDWNNDKQVHAFSASYPLGLHMTVDTRDAKTGSGKLYVDDIRVRTHLPVEARLDMQVVWSGESNLRTPGGAVKVAVANWSNGGAARKAKLSGGLYNWRGDRVAGIDKDLSLEPGKQQSIDVAQKVAQGAYRLKVQLKEGNAVRRTVGEDLLVLPPQQVLGDDWQAALKDEARLRGPLVDRYEYINHDWDWSEFQPGNLQPDTVLKWVVDARREKLDPYVVLGYSAYWASGIGHEELNEGSLPTRSERTPGARWWGGTVDIFQVPARLDDWDNYCREMMKYVGPYINGWMLWKGPDNPKVSLGVPSGFFAEMARSADRWRKRYAPKTPILIGGMSRNTALPYLNELVTNNAIDTIDGVNLQLDAGRLSPEDARVPDFVDDLRLVMASSEKPNKQILITDLDWAVEREGKGLDAFDQAAYLARASILLSNKGAYHALMLRGGDGSRLGLGLTYRRELSIPPMKKKLPAYQFKPAWWAAARVRKLLGEMTFVEELAVPDLYFGRTMCIVYKRKSGGNPVVLAWRNGRPGALSFADTGLNVQSVEDMFGTAVEDDGGWFPIGKLPVVFNMASFAGNAAEAAGHLRLREPDGKQYWSQQVLGLFGVAATAGYAPQGGSATRISGRTADGHGVSMPALKFEAGGSETFEVTVPAGANLVLRKRYFLDEAGQSAAVVVNGKELGTWNLTRSVKELSNGIRHSAYVIRAAQLAGAAKARVEVRYTTPANSAGWTLLTHQTGGLPLSALGPVHADSPVSPLRYARNVVGQALQVADTAYGNGIGVFANHFLEYALNGNFSRFTAEAGVDAATKGKGSVIFEVYADGKKVWNSPLTDGLAPPQKIDLDVSGVDRLRLLVTDGGDGNAFDAANWGNPELHL
jgi:hypothetical protein